MDTLWRLFSSSRLASALLLVLALAVALGALFPQIPDQAAVDPTEYARWLATVRERYPGWADALRTLGLFDVHHSLWFTLLLSVLTFSLLISIVDRWGPTWRSLRHINVQQPNTFFASAAQRAAFTTTLPLERALKVVKSSLARRIYRILVERDGAMVYLHAGRFRFAERSPFLVHVGLVVVSTGVILSAQLGWQEDEVILSPSQVYDVGHNTGASLRLDRMEEELHPDETAQGYRSQVSVLEGDKEMRRATISANQPLTFKGVTFYLSSHGSLVRVRGTDANGQPIFLQPFVKGEGLEGEIQLLFFDQGSERYFSAPALNVIFQLVFYRSLPERDLSGPVFLLRAYQYEEEKPLISDLIHESTSIAIAGAKYDLELDHYALLRAVHDPGSDVVMTGALIATSGLILSLCFSSTRLWGTMVKEKGVVAIELAGMAQRNEEAFSREFSAWVEGLKDQLWP